MRKRGFTLIELLVVVAIIGILATVIFVNLTTARERARDARRKSDLGQIRTALALYNDDKNTYPQLGWTTSATMGTAFKAWSELETELKQYIYPLPVDPLNKTEVWEGDAIPKYAYNYRSMYGGGVDSTYKGEYDLITGLENTGDLDRCGLKKYIKRFGTTADDPQTWCPTGDSDTFAQLYADH